MIDRRGLEVTWLQPPTLGNLSLSKPEKEGLCCENRDDFLRFGSSSGEQAGSPNGPDCPSKDPLYPVVL